LTGVHGIAVRLVDKVSRVMSLTHPSSKGQKVKDESVKDTLEDMINYACYGIMLLDGTWEEESGDIVATTSSNQPPNREVSEECPKCGNPKLEFDTVNRILFCNHCDEFKIKVP
jgi:hypothetical protein